MTGQVARVNGAQPNISPAIGSGWLSHLRGQPKPMNAGRLALVTLPTSPFWARRYTRFFLGACRGISEDTTGTAELLVSELVTNAVRYSERVNASLISLSLRHFSRRLLIEVYDADEDPPVWSLADDYAESGRGLVLVDALSMEWSYFFPPDGGKVVYCFLEIT
jgi:anti-sigma regulatory factor (Ser/Thr protein kinase)